MSDKSKTQVKRSKIPGKSINLVDNDNWHIVIPLDKDSSCFHGKNSDWCTTKPNQSYFEQYFYDRSIILIYCKNNKTGGMWAIAAHKDTDRIEMFDQNDNSMSKEAFNSQTGLNVDNIVAEASKHQPNISSSRDVYKEAIARIKEYLNSDNVGRNAQIEKDLILTKNGDLCFGYIWYNGKDDYPLSIQLAAVAQNEEDAILYIDNPSEKVQLAAVTNNGNAIEYIENPSEEMKLAAVAENSLTIRHIDNPSEAVQLAAVMQDGEAIQHIKNPSEKVQLAAITKYWDQTKNYEEDEEFDLSTFRVYIKNTKIQLAAVTRDETFINFIIQHNIIPSEQVQLAAVTKDGMAIEYIIDSGIEPSNTVQLAAVTNDGSAIQYIDDPSEKVQLVAVKNGGYPINFINNPSEAVQLAAVMQDGEAIKYIIRKGITPSEAVKKAAGIA